MGRRHDFRTHGQSRRGSSHVEGSVAVNQDPAEVLFCEDELPADPANAQRIVVPNLAVSRGA